MAQDGKPYTWNDAVLLMTLVYSSLDIQSEWGRFSTCKQPVHQWLLASFFLLLSFRLIHILGAQMTIDSAGEFMMNLRQKGTIPQLLLSMKWLFVMPAFSAWTIIGTKWLVEVWLSSSSCLPPSFFWFSVLWQGVSYCWILVHLGIGVVALLREWRIRQAEADLRSLEDPDTLERWGRISQNRTTSYLDVQSKTGLAASEINALKGVAVLPQSLNEGDQCGMEEECSICLVDFCPGDTVRRLPGCTHTFHRSCIDLWLLQNACCPLCKGEVKVASSNKKLEV